MRSIFAGSMFVWKEDKGRKERKRSTGKEKEGTMKGGQKFLHL